MASALTKSAIRYQLYRRFTQMEKSLNLIQAPGGAVGFIVPSDVFEDPDLEIQFNPAEDSVIVPVTVLKGEEAGDPLLNDVVLAMQTVVALLLSHEAKAHGRGELLKAETLKNLLAKYDLFSGFQGREEMLQLDGKTIRISAHVLKAYIAYMAEETMRQSA